jgi:hypothetical protein
VNIEGIIAVIGFALAAYAILPRWRQLDLAFRFRWMDGVLVTVGIAGLLYLQFFPILAALGRTPRLGLARWNVTTDMAASVLIGLVTVLLFLHMRTMALHPYRVARFARLVDELIQAKEYPALFTLLDRYMRRLWQIAQGQNGLQRLRRWMMKGRHGWDHEVGRPDFTILLVEMGDELEKPAERRKPVKQISRVREMVAPKLARIIPKQLVRQDEAQAILARVLRSDEVMRELVTMRPEILVPILRLGEKHYDFLDDFLRHLLRVRGSALYRQVAASQEVVARGRPFDIKPEGGLLDVLIGDATFAEKHSLWQPIAVEALAMFTELRRDPVADPYNVTYDQRFREEGRWELPFFIVVHYFNIMATTAMHAGVKHNMWLSYFTSFVEGAIENYKPLGPDYDPDREFPTRYSYLLYQMFSVMRDWVRAAREFPPDTKANILDDVKAGHGDDHVPTAATRALAMSLRKVLKADALETKFKHYLANIVFNLYFDMRQHGPTPYASLLLYHLTQDGYGGRDVEYGKELAEALETSDFHFRMTYRELEAAIAHYNGTDSGR